MTATIPCYLASAPTILQPAPGATVTSPVTFAWTAMAGVGWTYTAYVDTGPLFVVDDATSASAALPARSYPQLVLDVIGTGGWEPTATNTCGARTLGGPFTVTASSSRARTTGTARVRPPRLPTVTPTGSRETAWPCAIPGKPRRGRRASPRSGRAPAARRDRPARA